METLKYDVKGQDCPLPLITLKNALAEAQPGQLVEIEFTCPEATVNLPEHCQKVGAEVVSYEKGKDSWTIIVRK